MMADPNQSAAFLIASRQKAEFRAAQYRRLQAITKRINHDLMVKGNAALSYGGASYGAGMYALQPPELTRRLLEGHPQQSAPHGSAENPYQLLAPAGSGNAPAGHMQVTAVVATQGARTR